MLTIGKIVTGPGAARYYLDQIARRREYYYAGEGRRWGAGSARAPRHWAGPVRSTAMTLRRCSPGLECDGRGSAASRGSN